MNSLLCLYYQARISNVVEADPDVAAAMDILSFALYHENNKVVDNPNNPAVALGQTRDREEPDLTNTSDVEESDAKKQHMEEDNTTTSSSAPQVDTLADLKASIYADVSMYLEDSVSIDDICIRIEDRALVFQAIQSLKEESRVMHSEGEVYLID